MTYAICRIARFFESWLLLPDFCTHHPTLVSFLRIRFGSRPVPDPVPTRTRPVPEPTLRTRTRLPHDSHTSRPESHPIPRALLPYPFTPRTAFAAQWPPSLALTRVGRPVRPRSGSGLPGLPSSTGPALRMERADPHCVTHAAFILVGSNHHWLLQVLGRARTGVGPVPTTMAARASGPARRVRAATRLFSTYLPRELVGTRALAGGCSTDSRAGRIKGVRGR